MNGMINVLKPPGMSSSGVVVFCGGFWESGGSAMRARAGSGRQACWWCWPAVLPGFPTG